MEMTIDDIKSIINRNIALSQEELASLSNIPSNDFQEGLCKGSIGAYEHVRKMLEGEEMSSISATMYGQLVEKEESHVDQDAEQTETGEH